MKTPAIKVVSALRLCNPPALQLSPLPQVYVARHWQKKQLGFQSNLMSIPIESRQPPKYLFSFTDAKVISLDGITKYFRNYYDFVVSSCIMSLKKTVTQTSSFIGILSY